MAKLSLLDMTQSVLSSMGSDNVNTINQTEESSQVANIIKEAYYKILHERDWPFLAQLAQLEGPAAIAYPTRVHIPDNVSRIIWLKYNSAPNHAGGGDGGGGAVPREMKTVTYKAPEDFINLLDSRDSTAANVVEYYDTSGISLNLINDKMPSFWTSFDDEYIYFDSYDVLTESTVQASKTSTHAIVEPAWSHTDIAVPDLPVHMFPMLLAQATTMATRKIKQEKDEFEERDAKRQRTRIQATKWRENGSNFLPDYGRK